MQGKYDARIDDRHDRYGKRYKLFSYKTSKDKKN